MFGRTSRRSSMRSRLAALLGSAIFLSSMLGTVTPVAAAGPLSITNVDSPDPVQSGSQILYTIVITNTGGAKVSDVALTDQINGVVGFGNPPLLDVVSSRGSCTQTNTQITCKTASIEGGGVMTVTVRGIVTAAGGTTINNIATVVATKSAQTYTTSAAATTQVQGSLPGGPSPDLTIGKNGPLQITPGTGITYTLTINNLGTGNALGVKVIDTVAAAITITGVTSTSLFACVFPTNTVVCTGGRVNAGANATITINGTVAAAAAGDLENTSVVDPDNTIDEGILGNTADAAELNNFSNTVVTHVSPVPPPPTNVIFFDKSGPASAIPGEKIQYTLVMTNGNVGRADYITMTDGTQGLQAASLRVVSATSTSGTTPVCTVAAPTVECTMTRLATGGKFTVVIEGMVIASAGSTIINSGAVNANVKNTGYTVRDEVQTIINAGRDLTISKSDLPDPVCARSFPVVPPSTADCKGGLSYTFLVGNSGVQPANQVVIRDPLPPGTTFDDAATDAANAAIGPDVCDETGGIVTCTLATLAGGDSKSITIWLVAPATLGVITNTVTVDPFNSILESDETNNIAVESTTVATGIDLTIVKNDEPNDPGDAPPNFNVVNSLPGFDPIATSGTQTYTITVDNTGTQDASGIRVRDALPAGTIFLSATADNGFTCTHNAGVVECIGGAIHGTHWESYPPPGNGSDDATIIIKVFATPNVGVMHNEVRVDPLNEIVEYDETDNIEFEDTVVTNGGSGIGAFNELSITKTQTSVDPVSTSSVVTYNIVVTNNGTDPAVNVKVRDSLPTGFNYIEANDLAPGANAFLCTAAAGVINCNGATIVGAGGSRTIEVKAFSATAPGTYTNQAQVDPDNNIPEGNETNNAASVMTHVKVGGGFVDLTITKCDEPIIPACQSPAGTPAKTKDTLSLFTYFIRVTNNGTDPAFNVTARDVLPVGVTFVSVSDDTTLNGDFICTESAGVVTCTGGTLDGTLDLIPDDPATVGVNEDVPQTRQISILVRAPAVTGVTITNQAFVDPSNAIPESNETNNQAREDTIIASPYNLKLDKEGPDQAHQNDEEDYVITVTNLGAAVDDVVVVDALPIGLLPLSISATPSNFICTFTENPVNGVRCVGDMGAAGSATAVVTITVHVFVTQNGGPLDNEACVDPDNAVVESNEGDNCDTKTTDIVHFSPNLSVQKGGPSSASAGETITYTVSVSNIGDANAASPVTITDALPDQVSIVGTPVATNGFTCTHDGSATGGDVTCTDPSDGDNVGLAVGANTQITIQAKVADDADTAFTNTASVPNSTAPDLTAAPCDVTPSPCDNELSINNANNTDSVTTSVSGSAIDLVMGDITDVFDPSNIGDSLTYTVVITNGGSQNALAADGNEVVIRADMPTTGVTFTSGIASQGFVCAATNSNALLTCTGDLDAGESTTLTIEFTVSAATPPKLTLGVKVDPNDAIVETNEANNEAFEDTSVNTAACNSCIDLVMGQIFAAPNPVTDGGQTTYSFTVTNIGDQSTLTDPVNHDVQIRIDLDRTFDDSTFVSATATADFTCSQPFLLDTVPSTDILCKNTTTGLDPGEGTLITILTNVNTAATPSFVDFDVTVDPGNLINEGTFEFNNSGGLRIDVVAP